MYLDAVKYIIMEGVNQDLKAVLYVYEDEFEKEKFDQRKVSYPEQSIHICYQISILAVLYGKISKMLKNTNIKLIL